MPAPRKYPLELRERAVRMYRASEPKPVIRRLAEELGVHHEALRGWIRQAEADDGEREDLLTTAEREELVCPCRKPHPCRSSSMLVLVEDAAEAIVSTYVEAG
ncbi:transposase [Streptomyces sp. NPDC000941]